MTKKEKTIEEIHACSLNHSCKMVKGYKNCVVCVWKGECKL